jgi:hypothetical protein
MAKHPHPVYTADTWRLVAVMLCRYGIDATGEVEARIHACLEERDVIGMDSWRAVLGALCELLDPRPPASGQMH